VTRESRRHGDDGQDKNDTLRGVHKCVSAVPLLVRSNSDASERSSGTSVAFP
jgi:hypothetical protein